MTRLIRFLLAVILVLGLAALASAQAPATIVIGSVPSLPAVSTYVAIEKGYFRDAGIKVEIENLDSAANGIALLASNRMQVVEGGFAAGYWNALTQNLPVVMALERGSSPLNHNLMLPPRLRDKIKTIADLKGRTVAVNAPGSLTVYELGKVLESGGLALGDVEVKYLPFPQMGVAFTNGAIDAALDIPPFSNVVLENGLGVAWIDIDKVVKPYPQATIAYQINTDWAAKNPEVARNFMVAVARGARDYCQAYHHGPNREEIVDILMKYKVIADRALLERMPWQGRDPNGRFNIASAIDVQDWFYKAGMITEKFPMSRLIDTSYAEHVAQQLGPFTVINQESRLEGCR